MASSIPRDWLDGCIAAQHRLDSLVGSLNDDVARRPSLLPGWTVGHVLTHLARNADGHAGMVLGAQRGEIYPQYPGGREEREHGIAEGHGRPAAELRDDVRAADERLEAAWASTSDEVWATGLAGRRNGPATIADCVFLRWREVELHLIDLGMTDVGGPGWDDISPGYLDLEYGDALINLPKRVPSDVIAILVPGDRPSRAAGTGERQVVVRAEPPQLLAWLVGRGGAPSWPELGPWQS